MIGPFGGTAGLTGVFFILVVVVGFLVMLLSYEFWGRASWWFGLGLSSLGAMLLLFRSLAGGTIGPFGGGTDVLVAGIIVIALLGVLFLLLAHEINPVMGQVTFWVGVGLVGSALVLIGFGNPGPAVLSMVAGGVIVALLVQVAPEIALHYGKFRRWGHGSWWGGLALLVAALVFLGMGRAASATVLMLAGIIVFWVLALLMPHVTRRYTLWEEQWTVPDQFLTAADQAFERSRYTVLAVGAMALVAMVALVSGLPPSSSGPGTAEAGVLLDFDVDAELAGRGQVLFKEYGCAVCHNTDSRTAGVGPSLLGKFGKSERLDGGGKIVIDEDYVRESILDPNARIVRGYQAAVMAGAIQTNMDAISQPDNLNALVEFIKSLSSP